MSKAFYCLLHDLLIAKPAAYGFDYESLTLIQSYLSNRKQRNKVNNADCTFSGIMFRVLHGLKLSPLLFNIYICDMFYDDTDCGIASYADGCSSFRLDKLLNKLEAYTNNLFKWFHESHMKANADKCHLLVTTKNAVSANIGEFIRSNSNEEKRLSTKIDPKLLFEKHVSSLWEKASQKLHALATIVTMSTSVNAKKLDESFCNISVQLLSFNLDVS